MTIEAAGTTCAKVARSMRTADPARIVNSSKKVVKIQRVPFWPQGRREMPVFESRAKPEVCWKNSDGSKDHLGHQTAAVLRLTPLA